MSHDSSKSTLRVLTDNADVDLKEHAEDAYAVSHCGKHWLLWPLRRSWAQCDESGLVFGEIHYGSISAFNNKEILCLPNIPENHQKKWTNEELSILAHLVNANATVRECTAIFKRTEWSIVAKLASEHGINLDHHHKSNVLANSKLKDLLSIEKSI